MIDPWFIDQISIITDERAHLATKSTDHDERARMAAGQADSVSPTRSLRTSGRRARPTCERRGSRPGVRPTFKTVDTCGAEFAAETPYHYSTWEDEDEVRPSTRQKVMILGSGPNRIGQGIEFDYCCVHASFALRDAGFETIMVNCNPETVSTDYDTSDRLYFEPITFEDVANIIDAEQPMGIIVGLGGQTPLKLAGQLPAELVKGTSAASIDLAEDRERWNALCARLEIPQPAGGTAQHARRRRSASSSVSDIRCWCGLPTCSAAARWRSSTTTRPSPRTMNELSRFGTLGHRGWAFRRTTGARRSLPRRRHRSRCRCRARPHGRSVDRRGDGTRRRSRRAFGRLGVRHPAAAPVGRHDRR